MPNLLSLINRVSSKKVTKKEVAHLLDIKVGAFENKYGGINGSKKTTIDYKHCFILAHKYGITLNNLKDEGYTDIKSNNTELTSELLSPQKSSSPVCLRLDSKTIDSEYLELVEPYIESTRELTVFDNLEKYVSPVSQFENKKYISIHRELFKSFRERRFDKLKEYTRVYNVPLNDLEQTSQNCVNMAISIMPIPTFGHMLSTIRSRNADFQVYAYPIIRPYHYAVGNNFVLTEYFKYVYDAGNIKVLPDLLIIDPGTNQQVSNDLHEMYTEDISKLNQSHKITQDRLDDLLHLENDQCKLHKWITTQFKEANNQKRLLSLLNEKIEYFNKRTN